ncbi:hypothetical protein [Azospirillum endophyticum]
MTSIIMNPFQLDLFGLPVPRSPVKEQAQKPAIYSVTARLKRS